MGCPWHCRTWLASIGPMASAMAAPRASRSPSQVRHLGYSLREGGTPVSAARCRCREDGHRTERSARRVISSRSASTPRRIVLSELAPARPFSAAHPSVTGLQLAAAAEPSAYVAAGATSVVPGISARLGAGYVKIGSQNRTRPLPESDKPDPRRQPSPRVMTLTCGFAWS
jgi:hypothetical protein